MSIMPKTSHYKFYIRSYKKAQVIVCEPRGFCDVGKNLGLSPDWSANIIKQVGNYGESFDRNIGPNTPIKLTRGVNANWKKGGLMYGMPGR